MNKVRIFVLPTLEVITSIFTKVERFYNQEKQEVPDEIERFFQLRSSILSYLIFRDAFGKQSVDAPKELLSTLEELEQVHLIRFGKTINIFERIRDVEPDPISA